MERTKPMQTVVLLAALVVGLRLADAAQALPSLPRPAAYGDYAAGVATGFAADNRQRFVPGTVPMAGPHTAPCCAG